MDQLPHRPAYVPYLRAKALAAKNQNEPAWPILEPLLDASL
jgi:hypothetical protein